MMDVINPGYAQLVGKTLKQIRSMGMFRVRPVTIFVKESRDDPHGKQLTTDFGIAAVLRRHPGIGDYKVYDTNDYMETKVLRVEKVD